MLKESKSNTSNDKPVGRGSSLTTKFPGLGSKMQKIFRVFRKDNLSQSTQDLMMEEGMQNTSQLNKIKTQDSDDNGDEIVKIIHEKQFNKQKIVKEKRKMMVRAQALSNSDWSSENDFGSKTNLVLEKGEIDEGIQEIKDIDNNKGVVELFEERNKNSFSSGKKQRKRWSTPIDTHIISVPRKGSSSSTSEKGNSWFKPVKPIPAPRKNKLVNVDNNDQIDDLGLDNHGFESDQDSVEQILRIETEYGSVKTMKMEMGSVRGDSEEMRSNLEDISEIERLSVHSNKDLNVLDVKDSDKIERHPKPLMNIDSIDNEVQDNVSLAKSSSNSTSSRRQKKKNTRRIPQEVVMTDESTSSVAWNKQSKYNTARVEEDEAVAREIIRTRKEKVEKSLSSSSHSQTTSPSDISHSNKIKSATKSRKVRKKTKHLRKKKYISITVFKADMLEIDIMARHPMVIVHIVEESTGNYLQIPSESSSKNVSLQPLITGTFDFQQHKTMVPHWEEELIFEYDFEAIVNTSESNKILILFEIVDLPSFADARNNYDHLGGGNCWYKIAWAFLKPVSDRGVSHIDKSLRLQLYKPKRNTKKSIKEKCEPYTWWKLGYRDKYPSTLYVMVTSVDQPHLEPVYYGQLLLNDLSDEQSKSNKDLSPSSSDAKKHTQWSRLSSQSCKIPNEVYFNTESSENGCFFVAFSNNGKYLACANCEEYDYPITVYRIDEEKVFIKFSGHKSFIYSLDWSSNDHFLLSVSSDQTARIWDVKNKHFHEINMLPHSSYIYCGKFNPKDYQIVVTGCYDHIARMWTHNSNRQNYELIQELEGHKGFINCICFSKEGDFLTGDSLGIIIQWNEKKRKGRSSTEWVITRKIKLKETNNVVINTIILYSTSSQLILHTRDNQLRMIDLTTGTVVQRYNGLKNSRIQITARISPCGKLLLCGGEDAILNVWNIETGKCIAMYQQNESDVAITCVDYHPHEHVLAFCIFGCTSEVKILRFNRLLSGESVGLKMLDPTGSKRIPSGIQSYDSSSPSNSILTRRESDDSDLLKNKENKNLDENLNDSREDLRLRLKMYHEHEQELKSKSTNKLSGIIAKIDRMLSHSPSIPRSSYDIEVNKLEDTLDSVQSPKLKSLKKSKNISSLSSTFKDKLTPSLETETIEMENLSKRHSKMRKRSKSRHKRNSFSSKNQTDNLKNVLPDNTKRDYHRKSRKRTTKSSCRARDQMKEIQERENRMHESSEGSGGTYTVDIDKTPKSDRSDDARGESGSSVRSNVTFIIEKEKPVAKPRKKSTKTSDNSINHKSSLHDLV
ncbi:jouberin-like [Chelonus insularis]|uniref:jouberin-like n=1 Tax=Chelonus insularis TaxID=460826 RepID=UPI0015883E2B|nr:jouberin-like [Chelonus insularis]